MPNLDYNQMVDRRLATDSTEIFGNYSRDNAKYIIPAFIRSARKSVIILSGSFPKSFYDDIAVSLLEAAARISSMHTGEDFSTSIAPPIRIVALNANSDDYLSTLVGNLNEKPKCKGIAGLAYAKLPPGTQLNHFLVVDGKRYRLEAVHSVFEDNVPDVLRAEVCCNGVEKATQLTKLFDLIWQKVA